jgi:acylphosphatase
MSAAVHAFVSGHVQGVGFRYHVTASARELGLTGWVRNLPDGRVEVWAEGAPERVDDLVARLRRGPAHAEVSDVEVDAVDPRAYPAFEVRRG